MIRSMTGFGEAFEQIDGVQYAVDLRSLNNRYFKCSIRLSEPLSGLEAEIESQLRKRLNRGSISLAVKMHVSDAKAAHRVNNAALMAYVENLETIHTKIATNDRTANIDLTALLALPGVLETEDDQEVLRRAKPIVLRLVNQTCDRVEAMRATEGEAIARDLAIHREVIGDRLEMVKQRAPLVIQEYHQRLRARIDELLARAKLNVDQVDLIREVAIFAERADIAEEVSRLAEHLEQFKKLVVSDSSEPAGRVLEFLTQEMLREANTVANKCNDATVSRAVVDVKGAIDRLREQAHNVE